jgi:hypothetical protein
MIIEPIGNKMKVTVDPSHEITSTFQPTCSQFTAKLFRMRLPRCENYCRRALQPVYIIGLEPLFCQRGTPLTLGRFGGRMRKKNTVSGIHKGLNYCLVFVIFIQFTNVAEGRVIQPGGPLVADPQSMLIEN